MYGIGKIWNKKYGKLIFSLSAGLAYFIIILDFIIKNTAVGGLFLGFMFMPAIVAGAALIIIKSVNRLIEEEKYRSINVFLYFHIVFMVISILFLLDIIF